MERWTPLRGYPGYSISDQGRIRNDRRDAVLANHRNQQNQLYVSVTLNKKQVVRSVAKLVCEAYIPNPKSEFFTTPIHLDGDLSNCRADNLMWRPRWFALKFTRQFKMDVPPTRSIRNKKTGEVFRNMWDLVTRDGLLYMDTYIATSSHSYVWPTMEFFEWVE